MANLFVSARVDGVDYSLPFQPDFTSADHIREVWFGAFNTFGAFPAIDIQIRNITIGTTGYGSSDIWAPALASTAEFDSLQGTGSGLTVIGGVLHVSNSGDDRYGVRDLGADYHDIYVQFEISMDASTLSLATSPSFHNIAEAGGGAAATEIEGLGSASSAWSTDLGDTFGTGATADTWFTVGVHWSYGPFVTLTPVTGPAGTHVVASGGNFSPNSPLSPRFQSLPATDDPLTLTDETTTEPDGAFFDAEFDVPAEVVDIYNVVFEDGDGHTGSAAFTLTPTLRIRFSDPPIWRVIVTNLAGTVLTTLDKRSTDRTFLFTLDQPAVHAGVVPADDPEINIPSPDFDSPAFLSHNTRLVYGLRRELPTVDFPWVCRFGGIVNNIEDTGADAPTSRYTASDPWQYLFSRPIRDPDTGTLPLRIGLKFKDARASDIAVGLLAATVAVDGDVFIDASDSGLIEATDVIPGITSFEQGLSVGEAWQRLCDTGTIDIYLRPIYDPAGRPGKVCQLEIYKRAGSTRFDAVFGWDKASRSLTDVSRLVDGTRLANNVKIFSGQGGAADQIPVQTDALSETTYGSYWSQQAQVGSQGQAGLVALAALADLELRKRAPRTLQFSAAPERSYLSLRDYGPGDYVPVWSSKDLREPLGIDYDAFDAAVPGASGFQRIRAIPISVDDNGVERVTNVITEDSGVGRPTAAPPSSGFTVTISGGTSEGDTATGVIT